MENLKRMKHDVEVYRDPKRSVEARVKDLIRRMSLEEKVGQMTQIERRIATADPTVVSKFFIGSMLSACGSGPHADASFSDWAEMVNGFQKSALETRLRIPLLYGIDAIHGNGSIRGATVFPHNVGLGATRDADLVERIGVATALEVRASGIHCTFAPCVAVCKDPRWGRCYESYSEDTEIVRNMTSFVTGLQGHPPPGHPKGYPFVAGRNKVIACAKHFVGDGGTDKGLNEGDTVLPYDELERVHMAPYLDCIEKGVSMVMASYSSWNGQKMHSNRYLLTDVLKHKLGFEGIVISDWRGIDRLSEPRGSNYRECIGLAINSGIDMVIVPYRYDEFIENTLDLVNSGEVTMARIDDAVERILRVKFTAGLFEHPYTDPSLLDLVGCKLHRDLAREAVRKSLVLLKNGKSEAKPFLPLKQKPKRILVAGTHADDLGYQCGAWTRKWQGLSDNDAGVITTGTTILDGIREALLGEETEVIYERTPAAATLARRDVSMAIVAIGEYPYAESFGDDPRLELPAEGLAVLGAVAERFPTVAILISGRPMGLAAEAVAAAEAVVAAWWPGTEGGGIADVVVGEHEFHGKLPVSWFRSVEELESESKSWGDCEALFPLGFGLTKYGGGEEEGLVSVAIDNGGLLSFDQFVEPCNEALSVAITV